jgi:hypothetical protein
MLFSNTLSLCFSLNVKTPSFTPIQNNWQNYGFVYFNLTFLDSRQEDRRPWTKW